MRRGDHRVVEIKICDSPAVIQGGAMRQLRLPL
jgi:hypothetical protein